MTVQQATLSQIVGSTVANQQLLVANVTAVGGANVHSDANLTFDYANGQLTVTSANANASYNIALFQGAATFQNQNSQWVTIATAANLSAALSFSGNGRAFSGNDFWVGMNWDSTGYVAHRAVNDIIIATNSVERMRVNGSGYMMFSGTGGVGAGGVAVPPTYFGGKPGYFFAGNGNQCFPCFSRFEATPFGVSVALLKSRAATIGLQTAAQNGDNPGDIVWVGTDGTNWIPCARIMATHDGTISTNALPTAIGIFTVQGSGNVLSEFVRFTGSGQVTCGTTTPGNTQIAAGQNHKVSIQFTGGGTLYGLGMLASTNSTNFLTFATGPGANQIGSISGTTTAIAYNVTSDYRLKHNVQDLGNGIKVIMNIKPRTFNWHAPDGEVGVGFLAHEVQEHVPHAVMGDKDEVWGANQAGPEGTMKMQQLDYTKLIPHMVAAIQEQQAQIESLKADNKILKGKLGL